MTGSIAYQAVDEKRQQLEELSLAIWNTPEGGYHEYNAQKWTAELLEKNGFAVELAAIRPASGCHACMSRSSLCYGPCWTRATGTQHHLPGNGQRRVLP